MRERENTHPITLPKRKFDSAATASIESNDSGPTENNVSGGPFELAPPPMGGAGALGAAGAPGAGGSSNLLLSFASCAGSSFSSTSSAGAQGGGGGDVRRTRRGMAVLSLPRIVIPKSPNLAAGEAPAMPFRHR